MTTPPLDPAPSAEEIADATHMVAIGLIDWIREIVAGGVTTEAREEAAA